MIRKAVTIDEWQIVFYFYISSYYIDEIMAELQKLGTNKALLRRIESNMLSNRLNTGFTYSNKKSRQSVVVIGMASSRKQFVNSVFHEIRHVVDDIADTYRIAQSGESVAYLTGDIAMLVSDEIAHISCGCKKCKEDERYGG